MRRRDTLGERRGKGGRRGGLNLLKERRERLIVGGRRVLNRRKKNREEERMRARFLGGRGVGGDENLPLEELGAKLRRLRNWVLAEEGRGVR